MANAAVGLVSARPARRQLASRNSGLTIHPGVPWSRRGGTAKTSSMCWIMWALNR